MNNNSISLEEKLFSAIQNQAAKNSCWKKETMEILGLGKSAFYNRLSGQTPLHLKDAFLLAKHFNIPVSLFFDQPKEEIQIKFLLGKNHSCDLLSSIEYLMSHFDNSLEKNPFYFSANGLPFFYLSLSPPLFHFYLLYQVGFPVLPTINEFEKIFLRTTSLSPIYLQIEKLSKAVVQSGGIEWWDGLLYSPILSIFENFLSKNIEHLKEIHFSTFFNHLQSLHEKVCFFVDRKIQNMNNPDHQIYFSQNLPGFEFYLFYNNTEGKIITRFYNNLVEIREQKLILESKNWLQNQINGNLVFPITNHSRIQFFLKKSIEQIDDYRAKRKPTKQSHFYPFI